MRNYNVNMATYSNHLAVKTNFVGIFESNLLIPERKDYLTKEPSNCEEQRKEIRSVLNHQSVVTNCLTVKQGRGNIIESVLSHLTVQRMQIAVVKNRGNITVSLLRHLEVQTIPIAPNNRGLSKYNRITINNLNISPTSENES
ncbi:hypothetical protein CEXT_655771 [Caerostris extrusa]|uniref:Uncharacterized protein n=1 Tax=Caerostris extrusa TaxID=172846 RepID=A0AAV4MRE3_CAEEX|nr:hypothetical protein CEXT_655771 [Caerostris extrusa]